MNPKPHCLFSTPKPVISTEGIHSTTVNRAAEKPAFRPIPPPGQDTLALAVACSPVHHVHPASLIAVAARVGNTRLIDNINAT